MVVKIELEREADGRWLAEIPSLAGVMTYGATRDESVAKVQALALRVFAERLEHSEAAPELLDLHFLAALLRIAWHLKRESGSDPGALRLTRRRLRLS